MSWLYDYKYKSVCLSGYLHSSGCLDGLILQLLVCQITEDNLWNILKVNNSHAV